MSSKFILLIGILACCALPVSAQTPEQAETDRISYDLYQRASWKELLVYGKEAVRDGRDFNLLRLRLGYAAFMLGNYSEALKHYDALLKRDHANQTAHYYAWLCRTYLNQPELAGYHIKYFPAEWMKDSNRKGLALMGIGAEFSYKSTDQIRRSDASYGRLDVANRWTHNVNMHQAVGFFQQTINEPALSNLVQNKNNINIAQKEYYNKLTLNLDRRWQLKAAYHLVYTPFNNFIYYNHLGMLGLQYHGNYVNWQADAVVGQVTDTIQQQYNLSATYYPLGNLNLYGISTLMLRNRQTHSGINVKQVVGFKWMKKSWLEANTTLGSFNNLSESDGLYLYNAIDANQFKAGLTMYWLLNKHLMGQLGYTFEQRAIYFYQNTFNQHSITGGLSWKF
jgi:hypothetical protein